jgi:cysteine-rich repeat protein
VSSRGTRSEPVVERAVTPAAPRLRLIVPIVAVALRCAASTAAAPSSPRCGNDHVENGETCDDGNTNDDDHCPNDCVVDPCTPLAESRRSFTVFFSPPRGTIVGAVSVLVTGIETEQLCRVHFEDCARAPAPSAADFTCTVVDATDPFSNPLAGATCTVGP